MSPLGWFRTGPAQAVDGTASEEMVPRMRRAQWRIFLSLLFGYACFYTCRLSLSVAKKPMLAAEVVTLEELGLIGSALFFTYAFGKLTNGFLADYANIRKMMSFGLLMSALLNLAFGALEGATVFEVLWGLNGRFQSMGSAPSVVALSHWFSNRERGTRYGVWSTCHS